MFAAHQACKTNGTATRSDRRRSTGSGRTSSLRFELEARPCSRPAPPQAGFIGALPFLYENVANLVVRRAILERRSPRSIPWVPSFRIFSRN